jgi:hypothetical protein
MTIDKIDSYNNYWLLNINNYKSNKISNLCIGGISEEVQYENK